MVIVSRVPCDTITRNSESSGQSLTAKIYYSKRIQSKIIKARRSIRWSSEESKHKLLGLPFLWSHRDALTSSSNKLRQLIWTVQGSLLETPCPRFSGGAVWRGTLWRAHAEFQTPRGKADIQPKPQCVNKQVRQGATHNSSGNDGKLPEIQVSRGLPRASFTKSPF